MSPTKVLILGSKEEYSVPAQRLSQLSSREDLELLSDPAFGVIALPLSVALSADGKKHLLSRQTKTPSVQLIVVTPEEAKPQELVECINSFPVFSFADSFIPQKLDSFILSALDRYQSLQQDQKLESLVKERYERLKNFQKELEERVEKRQSFLLEARAKNTVASSRWESLLQATEAIQQAESVGEIESSLSAILAKNMEISFIRIYFRPQDSLFIEQQKHSEKIYAIRRSSLHRNDSGEEKLGSIFFLRKKELPFHKDENDFLQKITEVVSFAIDRLDKLKQTLSFTEQWTATFNAVLDPVIILNENHEVLQSNLAFQKISQGKKQKCYETLFHKTSPCSGCQRGNKFRITNESTKFTYDVFSQSLPKASDETVLFVNQYHEITHQLEMEKTILESAPLAEIGLIGSSIAHELNNPLGGALNFAQLIKIDLSKDNPHYDDILEIENGLYRCRDIIQNLLVFTRSPSSEEWRPVDLKDILARSLKIVEIQSKSMGVEVRITQSEEPIIINAYFGHLAQALQNILAASLQSISEAIGFNKISKGFIEIQLSMEEKYVEIKILDNGLPSEEVTTSPSTPADPSWAAQDSLYPIPKLTNDDSLTAPLTLSLSLARQILHDHHGKLDLEPNARPFRVARIVLPRPEII